jgi:hypothetical protein
MDWDYATPDHKPPSKAEPPAPAVSAIALASALLRIRGADLHHL